MPSLKSRWIRFLLKHRHWFQLKLRRPVVDWDTSIDELRQGLEVSAKKLGKLPEGVEVVAADRDGPAAEWIRPVAAEPEGTILYFHGGGYVMGSARAHRWIVAKFVAGSGLRALVFDYRLAPEHPFPAALDDSLAAYRWLLASDVPASRILFVGDSAGGGLCLATLLALKERGDPLPRAAVAMSPWTDLRCTGESYSRPDPLAPEGSWEVFSKYYAGEHDPDLPLISPLYGDLAGLPPLYLSVGGDESMLDDATAFAAKAGAAGVEVELAIGKGMVHCYPVLSPLFPEAEEAMGSICAFLKARLDA